MRCRSGIVYFNPIVGDEHGKKMSKSKGNAIDPLELMDQYGTDALRFTLCAYASRDQHIAFNVKECEGYRNFMNKLWNAARLVFANLDDLGASDIAKAGPAEPGARAALPLEDRWILSRYGATAAAVNEALAAYEFDTAVKAIYDFVWKDFCDYYLELVKPRLYAKDAVDAAIAHPGAGNGDGGAGGRPAPAAPRVSVHHRGIVDGDAGEVGGFRRGPGTRGDAWR